MAKVAGHSRRVVTVHSGGCKQIGAKYQRAPGVDRPEVELSATAEPRFSGIAVCQSKISVFCGLCDVARGWEWEPGRQQAQLKIMVKRGRDVKIKTHAEGPIALGFTLRTTVTSDHFNFN